MSLYNEASLSHLMFEHLKKGKIPKTYTAKPVVEVILKNAKSTFIQRRTEVLNRLFQIKRSKTKQFFKPLLKPPVVIDKYNLSGYVGTLDSIYLANYGEKLTFTVSYINETGRPVFARLYTRVGDVEKLVNVLFMAHAPYDLAVEYNVSSPLQLSCYANSQSIARQIYDEVNVTYTVGVFDNRYKPTGEYPMSGCDNAVLDIAYAWSVSNLVYPTPLPSGLSFTNLSVRFISGFVQYGGRYYKDPRRNNTVRVSATIVNNTGYTLTVSHYGLPVSVLYEDNRRVSMVNVSVSFPTVTIPNGSSYPYTLDVNIPRDFYGKVAVAHALNFYRDGFPIYYGGPLYQFEVFRLMLP